MKPTIKTAADWAQMRADFRWPEPARFNIATAICDGWAQRDPDRIALVHPDAAGTARDYSYRELSRLSNKFANALAGAGLSEGARVAILLPQVPESLLTHLATYKLGGVVVPLFTLFGADGLRYRLQNSGAEAIVTDSANLEKIMEIRADLPELKEIFSIDGDPGVRDFWASTFSARDGFVTAETKPDDPALLVYTSGTTGPPKGALHGHRVLIGHLPGFETHHDFAPQPGDRAWTPADWAWMGGLADILLPSLALGIPVVASRMPKFDPEMAYDLMKRQGVRNAFLPPTALKYMRSIPVPDGVALRSVASGGEALGAELLAWGQEALGVTINEFYGSTECNLVLGNSATVLPPRPGSTGKAVPGKDVAILDPAGQPVAPGTRGEIAVKRGDPAMFLEYWQEPDKTAEKFSGDWLRMGDEGHMDEDGFVYFSARTDDVITSAGYRIGPAEIEDCLTGHPDIALAAAVGVPDPDKGEVVKAFVVMKPGAALDAPALIDRVKTRLSPHVAPRQIEEIADMPVTATGKILRRELKER